MRKSRLPKLIRRNGSHLLVGFLASAVLVGMLLGYDIAGLTQLASGGFPGLIALFVLWVVCGLVLSAVQFGLSSVNLRDDDDDTPGGGLRAPVREYAPVRVPVSKPRRKI
ncbi:hypothetical protein [Marinovum sp.]|uniref:hypothetical protein n=1 Tax=Marinovum sp. TaxID=2024839 RepID=UPI002B26C0E2|nr:hypothetical protein [Marinovum sp.]